MITLRHFKRSSSSTYLLFLAVFLTLVATQTIAAEVPNKYARLVGDDSIRQWTGSLTRIKGFPRNNSKTVMGQTADKTKKGLIAAFDTITKAMQASSDPEFVFYYVGRGNSADIAFGSDENSNTMHWRHPNVQSTTIYAAGIKTDTLAGNLLRIPN